jgi:WD40 repeat protein
MLGAPLPHQKEVLCASFKPDGSAVLTRGRDNIARIWPTSPARAGGRRLGHDGSVTAVAFRPPDGRVLLTGSDDRTARLWDAATGRPLGAPFQHPARVLSVAFSPDGRTVATGCGDGLARLWGAATGYPIGRPLLHRGPVRAVVFGARPRDTVADADGESRTLVTGSEDKTARVWDVPGPQTGPPERIMLALQVANGAVLDAQGVAESLAPGPWHRLRRDLLAAGSPPPP